MYDSIRFPACFLGKRAPETCLYVGNSQPARERFLEMCTHARLRCPGRVNLRISEAVRMHAVCDSSARVRACAFMQISTAGLDLKYIILASHYYYYIIDDCCYDS